jgi:hypothetical protein
MPVLPPPAVAVMQSGHPDISPRSIAAPLVNKRKPLHPRGT